MKIKKFLSFGSPFDDLTKLGVERVISLQDLHCQGCQSVPDT